MNAFMRWLTGTRWCSTGKHEFTEFAGEKRTCIKHRRQAKRRREKAKDRW
ncbi:MAG TPA: hypothetical protein VGO16_13460 [Pseudonocardiaceae bacterium]|nr:hypothetical protein [Pseudonocardiaceae bacterium]